MALQQTTFGSYITYARTGAATVVNSDGLIEDVAADTPRFDHDPVTGAAKGLLIEEARTNIWPSNTDMTKWDFTAASARPDSTIAPDGTASADKLIEDTTTASHYASDTLNFTTGTEYTLSVFAKAAEQDKIFLQFTGPAFTGFPACRFDLTNGVLGTTQGTVTAEIEDYGSGWYRCSITATTVATDTSTCQMMITENLNGSTSYTGDGTSGLYFWCPQIESGGFKTSLIKTADSFTSRASTATYTDSAGVIQEAAVDEARTTYKLNDGTWTNAGDLFEAAETNELTNSQDFGDAYWSVTRSVLVRNRAIAPDGTASADKLIEDKTASATHQISLTSSNTILTSTDYIASVYAKAAERSICRLRVTLGSVNINIEADLGAGSISDVSGEEPDQSGIEDVGDGWYRIYVVGTSNNTNADFRVQLCSAINTNSYNGNGTSGIYIWGAQLEQSSLGYPTSYIPTPDSFTSRTGDARYTDSNGVIQVSSGADRNANHAYIGGQWVQTKNLYEGFATNEILQSEDLDTTWVESNSTVTVNQAVAPDGTTTADLWVPNTNTSTHYFKQTHASTAGTFSIYAKAAGYTQFSIWMDDVSTRAEFDLATGTATAVTVDAAGIEDVGNGWFRCWAYDSAASLETRVYGENGGGFTGDGTSGFYFWGAMLTTEIGPSSYIPTTTTTVDRNADVTSGGAVTRSADVVSSGAATRGEDRATVENSAFSDWFNQDEGTVFVEFLAPLEANTQTKAALRIDDGTTSERHSIYITGVGRLGGYQVTDGGVDQVNQTSGSAMSEGSNNKIAVAFKANDFLLSVNGTALADTSGTLPTVTRMQIGRASTSGQNLNGHIKHIQFYPTRLSNAELQALTT